MSPSPWDVHPLCFLANRLLEQKKAQMGSNLAAQMGNNLAEQQVSNNNKAKKKEKLFSPLSQVLKTCDFGKYENYELNIDITLIYLHLDPLMYHMCKNLHRRASPCL